MIEQFEERVFDESYPRIQQCLDSLSEEQIWARPNESSNSIGNLVLHLCGNMNQWIVSGLYQKPDKRERHLEFDENSRCSREELLSKMESLKSVILYHMKASPLPDLLQENKVQVFTEDGVSILVHVIEHFSYHTGQIALLTKLQLNEDLKFYGDLNLEI